MPSEIKDRMTARVLTESDVSVANAASTLTQREEALGRMVYHPSQHFLDIYRRADGFGVIEKTETGEIVRGHATIHDAAPLIQRYGPGNVLKRSIYEVSSVFGNGHAADAVVGLIRERRGIRRRLQEGRLFSIEQYIAFSRIDNVQSNRLFGERIPGSRRLTEEEMNRLPQVLLDEPVGTGENARKFNGYDVTRVGRRRIH